MKRTFINQTDDSNKFWTIEQLDSKYLIQWGKIGASARSNEKEFATKDECAKEIEKLIQEKTRKGYSEINDLAAVPEKPASESKHKSMNEDVFWEIIASFNWKKAGDDDAVMKPALKKLVSMQIEDIEQFAEILAEKLYTLDGLVYAVCSGEFEYPDGYLSPDMFLYARCAVVVNGKDFYYDVLKNPLKFPHEMDFESLLYLAEDAYNKKLKTDGEYIDTKLSYETGSNSELWNKEQVTEQLDKLLKEISQAIRLLNDEKELAESGSSKKIKITRYWTHDDSVKTLCQRPRIDYRIDEYLFDFINAHILTEKGLMQTGVHDFTIFMTTDMLEHNAAGESHSGTPYDTKQVKYDPLDVKSKHISIFCCSSLFTAQMTPTEYVGIVYDMFALYFTLRCKELTKEIFDELKQKIDYDFINSFEFPAPFENQRYSSDEHSSILDDETDEYFNPKEAYLKHFGK